MVSVAALETKALVRACRAETRHSQRQVPLQLQHSFVSRRTSKMLKGQEGNMPFVITCCSSIALASSQIGKGRTGQSHHLPRHLLSSRHGDTMTERTQPARASAAGKHAVCPGAWSRLMGLLSTLGCFYCVLCVPCVVALIPHQELSSGSLST